MTTAHAAREIVHVVLAAWADGRTDAGTEATRLVDEHLGRIDGVLSTTSGPSIGGEGLEDGFHWMLVVRFRDREALEGYLPHPDHRVVADHIGASAARVVVFDTEA
nr:Stress responsive A/B Barrel Domain [uncultured organism]